MTDELVPFEPAAVVPSGSENAHSHNLAVHEQPADRHPAAVYLASLQAGSRRSTRQALGVVATFFRLEFEDVPWEQLRYQHTQAVRAHLLERYAPATVNKVLAALRGVLREAHRLGLMSAEDMTSACDLRSARGTTVPPGRALQRDELAALRGACDVRCALGARDLALLSVLFAGGLRRSEAVGLELEDVVDVTATGVELRVRGKGGKERQVYLSALHSADVTRWLEHHRGRAPGALFCPVLRGGRVVLRRLTDQAVLVALRRLAKRAGTSKFSPHDARRTFISRLLDAGADIATVAKMAGHAQVTTTARYDRRGERAARAAAELLDQ